MNLERNPAYYRYINYVVLVSFALFIIVLLLLNQKVVVCYLANYFDQEHISYFKSFSWGALGGTIFSSRYFASDKELNVEEAIKKPEEQTQLRWPDKYDVWMYVHHIICGGVLGVVFSLLFKCGLVVVDAKGKGQSIVILTSIVSFVSGLYQSKALGYLDRLINSLLKDRQKEDASLK